MRNELQTPATAGSDGVWEKQSGGLFRKREENPSLSARKKHAVSVLFSMMFALSGK
jgi:hypothetical protein